MYITIKIFSKINLKSKKNKCKLNLIFFYSQTIFLNPYLFELLTKFCFDIQKNGSRVLYVSKNQGDTFSAAQLKMISDDEFYAIIDISEEQVMIHVDGSGG